jgi:hypothetical protein
MERLGIEFKDTQLIRSDLDFLDSFFEHRRFLRAKLKALYRDWERDKKDLKAKTVSLIDQEAQETREKLLRELELQKLEAKREKKHVKLEEKRKEYEERLQVIEEIERERRRVEQAEEAAREARDRERAAE